MKIKSLQGWMKHWDFILIDLLTLQVCFILVYWILRGFGNPYDNDAAKFQAMLLFSCQVLIILFSNNYSDILRRSKIDELFAIIRYIIGILILAFAFMFLMHNSGTASRLQIGFTSVAFLILCFIFRELNKRNLRKSFDNDKDKKHLVLFTASSLIEEAREKLYKADFSRDFILSRIVLLEDEIPDKYLDYDIPIKILNDETIREISHDWVDEAFILQPNNILFPTKLADELITMGITVNYTMAAITNGKWEHTEMAKLGAYNVVTNGVHFVSPGQVIVKRIMDICGGIIGCLITGILCLFIGPAIYLADPGPIFFSQVRIGENGKHFKVYKFRSMYMDAEERKAELQSKNRIKDGMMFKMDDDPRIIGSHIKKSNGKPGGIGNFIRNTSLDEFPQFYNVLVGQMSLVGWRPCTIEEWEKYELKHRIRASMKPGITGMWQISGRSTITDFDEVVRLDREYIENWSLALDVKILLKTIGVVLSRKGAE